jgi:hypothetical protein
MVFVHCTETPALTIALSWPSAGPKKVGEVPEKPTRLAVIGRAEYLNSCSQAALSEGSTMIFPICHR